MARHKQSINVSLSFYSDGSVNEEVTHENLTLALRHMQEEQESNTKHREALTTEQDRIVWATVDSVLTESFAANPTVRLTRDALVFSVVQKINAGLQEIGAVNRSVDRWMSMFADKAGTATGKPYRIVKGPAGGLEKVTASV